MAASLLSLVGEVARAAGPVDPGDLVRRLQADLACDWVALIDADSPAGAAGPVAAAGSYAGHDLGPLGPSPGPDRLVASADGRRWLVAHRGDGFAEPERAAFEAAGGALTALLGRSEDTPFRFWFEALPLPAMLVQGLKIVSVNQAMERLTGYDADTLRGGGLATVLARPDPARVAAGGLVALWPATGEAPTRARAVIGPYPGEPATQLIVLICDSDPNHGLDGMTAGLAGGIAHSFNNLLQAVVGYSSLGQAQCSGLPAAVHFFSQIEIAGQEMAQLTEDLVAYARVGLVQPRSLHFDEEIQRAVGMLTHRRPPRLSLGCPDIAIVADPFEVQLVVRHLVSNAYESGSDPDGIEVATAVVEFAGDRADAGIPPRPGRYARIRVRDAGTGVAEDIVAAVFRPFVSTKGPGRGLGLAAVEGVCLAHCGGVLLNTTPGRGTVVDAYFTIPAP